MKKLSINFFKRSGEIEISKNEGNTGGTRIKYYPITERKIFSEIDLWNIHRKRKNAGTRRWSL